jgi:hypothetical protein
MLNNKVKVIAISLLVGANVAYFVWFRVRGPELPASMQEWVPLEERKFEERQEIVATYFALSQFDVQPYVGESKFVTIPRADHWLEQMIVSRNLAFALSDFKAPTDSKATDSTPPWGAGPANYRVVSVNVSEVKQVKLPEANLVLMDEKVLCRDSCWTKNGIIVPGIQIHAVGRYTVDVAKDKLESVQWATVVDGSIRAGYVNYIPHWLVPTRKLAIGETWAQVGVSLLTASKEVLLPKVEGKVNRLVTFEGRPAVEISSTATSIDYSNGADLPPVTHVEKRLCYFDLETGEPLWFEAQSRDSSNVESVTRGFNQKLSRHLIRTTET